MQPFLNNFISISIIFTNRLVSTTAHGYHCAPTPTPTTFKETARSETSLTPSRRQVEEEWSGASPTPPLGGVAPFRGSALSMTAIDKKLPQALFTVTTSSLLKLANHTMHGSETWYACVFERFQDNHSQKIASGTFPVTTSSLLKLAHHTMHGGENWYTRVF